MKFRTYNRNGLSAGWSVEFCSSSKVIAKCSACANWRKVTRFCNVVDSASSRGLYNSARAQTFVSAREDVSRSLLSPSFRLEVPLAALRPALAFGVNRSDVGAFKNVLIAILAFQLGQQAQGEPVLASSVRIASKTKDFGTNKTGSRLR